MASETIEMTEMGEEATDKPSTNQPLSDGETDDNKKKTKKKKKEPRDVAKLRNEFVVIPLDAPVRPQKKVRYVRLPSAPPADAKKPWLTNENFKIAAATAGLLLFLIIAGILLSVDGPVSRVFRGLIAQMAQVFGFSTSNNFEYIPEDDGTTTKPSTNDPAWSTTTMRTAPPPTPRAAPWQLVPTATKEIDGSVYYFFHNEYKLENARKVCFELFNYSRLLYVVGRDESMKLAEWYYSDIYDSIRDWAMDEYWESLTGTRNPPIRLMWTAGYADFRRDYTIVNPHNIKPDEILTGRFQWLGVPNVPLTNLTAAFCDNYMRSVNEDNWLTFAGQKSTNDQERQMAAQYAPYFQLHLGIKMDRFAQVDDSAGCLMWEWLFNKEINEKTKLPFMCKRPVNGTFSNNDDYRTKFIIQNWLSDD